MFLSILAEVRRRVAVFSCTKTFFVSSSSNKNCDKVFAVLSEEKNCSIEMMTHIP